MTKFNDELQRFDCISPLPRDDFGIVLNLKRFRGFSDGCE
jgi:hypothetical protein